MADFELPRTWREAVPYVVWGVIILGFGLEFTTDIVRAEWLRAVISGCAMVGIAAMTLHWPQLRSWAMTISPNWIVGAFACLLLAIVFSPFIEEGRWPFANWFALVNKAAKEAQKETLVEAPSQRDAAGREFDSAQNLSPILRLTDAKRWRFISSFSDWPPNPNGPPHCYAWVAVEPKSESATALWAELSPLLIHSNWKLTVGWEYRPFFNNGITILSGPGTGDPFVCGTRLTESLQNQTPALISMHNNQVTTTLEKCKYECVEIQIGSGVER